MDDTRELVDRLCTLVGMILEDASAEALLIGGSRGQAGLRLQKIRKAASDAIILADAAAAALEHPRTGLS